MGGEAESPVMTVDEAAKMLRISRATAYEAVRQGELPVLRIGRRILVSRSALDAKLAAAGAGNAA